MSFYQPFKQPFSRSLYLCFCIFIIETPILRMRFHVAILITLSLLVARSVSSQTDFYQIFGDEEPNLCSGEVSYYGLETSAQLVRTIWTLIPDQSGTFLSEDLTSAVIQFYAPGTYTLLATSLTANQDTLTDTLTIYAYGLLFQPSIFGCYQAAPGTNCNLVCAYSQTTVYFPGSSFVDFEVTGAQEYTFDGQSGIEITWGPGGPGSVSVFSQNCSQTVCFEILPLPIADFETTPSAVNDTLTVCKNQEVYFENTSFNGLSYTWMFGDGEQYDGYDVSHTYVNEGYYTVTLSANSVCDCSDEKQIVIEVLPAPAPTLDCVNSVCPESRQRYTATTAGCTQYTWSVSANGTIVNGGGPSDDFIEVIWHEGPDGFIELAVSGCSTTFCSFTNIFRVPIITPDGPVSGDASVCSGEISTYTAPYFPGTQYAWQVGPNGSILGEQNSNAITVQWANVNTTSSSFVEVNYTNCFLECAGSDMLNISITPQIRLTGDIQVCQDGTATVMAEAGFNVFSPVNVSWHVEDAAGNIMYTAPGLSSSFSYAFNMLPGEYAVVATNASAGYCTETVSQAISVTAIPDTPLGIRGEEKICPGQPYGYTIESAGNFSTKWSITDGSSTYTYSGQTCQHTFGPVPPYIVEAAHTDIQYQACSSAQVTLMLGTATDLSINGPGEVCFNAIDLFSADLISGADYTWEIIPADFGEIKRSELNNVEVFWTQVGNATLRLNACGINIDHPVLIRALPTFNVVGPLAACENELVALSTDQPLYAHTWVNSNQVVMSAQNNIQLSPGSYGVEVTDGFGCVNKKSLQVTSYPAPVVHLSSAYEEYFCVTIPGGVEVVANTDGADYTYNWYLDDVLIGPGGPVFAVTTFGAYHVEVTNQYGCKAVSQKLSFFNCCAPSTCGFPVPGLPGGCALIAYDFSLAAAEPACNIHEYTPLVPGLTPGSIQWFIRSNSEGVIAAIPQDVLNYTYAKPGYYHIIMTGLLNGFPYDANTCGHYQNFTDTIRAVADFASTGICAGAPIAFEDLTTFLPTESIASWTWDFGDPLSGGDNTSAMQNPSHIFGDAGTYEVTLTINMASGCIATKKRMVDISAGPVLAPVYDVLYCEDEAMSFQLPGEAYDIQWTFGDPASGVENAASSDSVFHTFDLPGFYLVNVAASDIHTCRSQADFMVDITANTLSGLIDVAPITPLCAGDTAILTSPPGGLSWFWSTGENTPAIDVAESNQYNVLVRDQYNCTYSPPAVFVEVFPKPEVIIKAREIYGIDAYGPWSSSLSICYGTEFEISAFSTGNVSYQWTTGEATQVLQFTSEGANLPAPGMHEFTVTTTDLVSNCISDSAMIMIEIFGLPAVPFITLNSGSGCSFNPNVLEVNNPEAGVTYTWSDGQEGITITAFQAGEYQVTGVNQNGCSTTSNTIIIEPSAPVDQLPGGCFVACDPLDVCLPPLSQVSSFTIFQDGNVYLSGTTWPADFMITADGSYTFEITTINGCTSVSEPLDVILYPGVGSITVETWLDQDGDGLISGGDVLLPGIPVEIISDDGLHIGSTETVPGGQFVFEDFPSSGYLALIDRTLLSSQWKVVIDSVATQIATCDDSVVVSLLLMQNCTVAGPDQLFELCPGELLTLGDSTWSDTGNYEMHMSSVTGCDSVFQVVITSPDSFAINVVVWVDVDQNGIVSPVDTVIEGVTIVIDALINQAPYIGLTDINGSFSGEYATHDYEVSVDSMLLPPGLIVTYGLAFVSDTTCGEVNIDFLLSSACAAVFVIQQETLCPGDSLSIEGQWIMDAGQYTFVHSDPITMCDTIIDVYVTLFEEITVLPVVDWNCETNGSITLDISGAGPFTIVWGQGIPGDTVITGLDPGDYPVLITDINGCMWTDTISIEASPGLMFDVPGLYMIDQGDSVLIAITGDITEPGLTFQWIPAMNLSCANCPAALAYPSESTTYQIQITDEDSCVYNLVTNVVVTIDSNSFDQVYAPNVFSPNGDGINDVWTISSRLENTFVQDLAIFDRWGNMVFSQAEIILNTMDGWDGTREGKTINPGVFVYTARLILGDGQEVNLQGDITLVR
jgi:gliding motility-associated-like protein